MSVLKRFNLSYSAYSIWKKSQLQFYFGYVKHSDPTDKITQAYGNAGNAVHNTVQDFIEKRTPDFDKKWDEFDLDKQLGFQGTPLERDFYKSLANNAMDFFKNLNLKLYKAELQILKDFHGVKLKGYIDLYTEFPDGSIHLYDWKTDSTSPHSKHRLQRLFYSWLVWKCKGIIPSCHWVYLRAMRIQEDKFSLKEMEDFDNEIREFLATVDMYADDISKYEVETYKDPFNQYYSLCAEEVNKREDAGDVKFTLNIKGNFVFFEGDVPQKLLDGVDFRTKFDLPDKYWQQEAVKKKGRGVLYIEDVGTVHLYNKRFKCFPIGLLDKVTTISYEFGKHYNKKVKIHLKDSRDQKIMEYEASSMPHRLNTEKILRPYQSDAIKKFMKKKHGIINIPTGGGKTFVAAEIIREVDGNTLWLIDRKELLEQTREELSKLLNQEIGVIASGVVEFQPVTIATVQTLHSRLKELEQYLYTVNFMVIDEYHKSAAETYQKIFAKLPNTKYRLGLTATVDRDDGKSPILFANIGKTIYSISTKNLIEQGYLVKPNITFIRVPENHFSGEKYPEDYSENIVNNDYRNAKILHLASQDKKTLILTKMLTHGHSLNKMISGSRFIYGSLSAQNRTEAMQWFRETEGAVMIMTLSIGAEGLDIPDLDVIINAAANKGDVKSIQVLGRVLRIFQGKSEAQYIDFVDAGPHTRKHSNARIKAFKAQEHDVNTVD